MLSQVSTLVYGLAMENNVLAPIEKVEVDKNMEPLYYCFEMSFFSDMVQVKSSLQVSKLVSKL